MKFLLDTHIWLWSLLAPANLSRRVLRTLENRGNELWLSSISVWELFMLVEKKRLELGMATDEWLTLALRKAPVREASVTHEVAIEAGRARLPHRDPADRFLLATARVFELTLITADERLLHAKQADILANR